MIGNENALKLNLKDELQIFTAEGTSNIIQSVQSAEVLTHSVLASASESAQARLTDRLLAESFLVKIDTQAREDQFRRQIAFEFRSRINPLKIPFPEPVLEIRARSWAYTGCLGALLGMLTGGPLFHYLLDMRDVGVILGGSAGSLIFLMLVGYLIQHPRLLRTVQGAFGAATILEFASMAGATVNPLSILWRRVTKYFTGRGFIHRLKRIGIYLAGILVLQLAVPKARIPWDQLENNTRESIQSWLAAHLNTLLLVISHSKTMPDQIESSSEGLPDTLIRSIQKLSLAPPDQRAAVSEEVIQEFKNAGFLSSQDESESVFDQSLHKRYDVLGLINPGDPVKILEYPVVRDEKVIKKGRLTRRRG